MPIVNEIKSARMLIKALDVLEFKAPLFAHFITHTHLKIQQRIFQIMVESVWIWSRWYDSGEWEDEESMNLYAGAKRIQDALVQFGYRSDGE